jgi:hypothetical protein
MSAILQLVSQFPEQSQLPGSEQEQFDHLVSPDIPVEQKLICALNRVLQLQTENEKLRMHLARIERELEMKNQLLCLSGSWLAR